MILAAVTRRLFWFLLVDQKNGQPYMGTTVSSVSLEPTNVIDEFRDAVKAKYDQPNFLKDIPPGVLNVYKNKAAFEARNAEREKEMPLEGFLSLSDELGSRGQHPLYVAVPEPIPPPPAVDVIPSAPLCDIEFYNKLHTADEKNGWMDFQSEIPPFDLNVTRLCVRKSFKSIAAAILASDMKKSIVTGTPGIGKSFFLVYLLWKLVLEKKRVLFIFHPDIIYYDGQGRVLELEVVPRKKEPNFWTSDLWCLFDAKSKEASDLNNLPYPYCNFVVSMSPRRDLVNDFQKSPPAETYYMPIWSEDEISTLSCLYPKAVDWRERFEFLGGIPRLVFESKLDPSWIINRASKDCSLSDCLNEVGPESAMSEKTKIIHRLLHLNSSDPYTKPSVVFASREALNVILKEHEDSFNTNAKRLLRACEGNPLAAAFCGRLYERYAIDALEKGGNFTYRRLAHRKKTTTIENNVLIIPPSTKRIVDKVLDNQKSNQLYVPKSKTYKGIDAWMPSIGGFQITIATSHPIKESIANDVKFPEAKLYWVLPVAKYATFNHKALPNIEQFAILFPYPSVFTKEPIGSSDDDKYVIDVT